VEAIHVQDAGLWTSEIPSLRGAASEVERNASAGTSRTGRRHEIDIKPAPKLKPLLTHDGYVPEGWKDAIYEPDRGAQFPAHFQNQK